MCKGMISYLLDFNKKIERVYEKRGHEKSCRALLEMPHIFQSEDSIQQDMQTVETVE